MPDNWLAKQPRLNVKNTNKTSTSLLPGTNSKLVKKSGSDTTTLGKNPKLTPKWIGPYTIVDINDNNAKIETKPNKFKIINVTRLKAFQEELNKCLSQDDTCLSQDDNCLFEDNKTDAPQKPMTRALKKLIDFKNAADMAVSFIESKLHDECDGNMFSENYNKYHCANCYHGIRNFAHFASQMDIFWIHEI